MARAGRKPTGQRRMPASFAVDVNDYKPFMAIPSSIRNKFMTSAATRLINLYQKQQEAAKKKQEEENASNG